MKTVVIYGTDSMAVSAAELLNPSNMKLIGMADTRQENWNVFDENGEILEGVPGMPVMPIELAVQMEPDVLLLAAVDEQKAFDLRYLAIRAGFTGDIIFLKDLHEQFSVCGATLSRMCERLNVLGVPGAVAELGCYRGDTSWQLNVLMPERKLYLFDTFEGFDARDVVKEQELGCSDAVVGRYRDTKHEELIHRMPYQENVVIKKGWFPDTAMDIEDEQFALVYLDASLYRPTYAGIEFFFPRMSRGGIIVLRGCRDGRYGGVQRALEDLELKYGAFLQIPLGDLTGTVLIVHP